MDGVGNYIVSEKVENPLSSDAPIHHLLSIMHNPLVKDMSTEQLQKLVLKCRTMASSAPTLTAKLSSESNKRSPRRKQTLEDKLAAKGLTLDDI